MGGDARQIATAAMSAILGSLKVKSACAIASAGDALDGCRSSTWPMRRGRRPRHKPAVQFTRAQRQREATMTDGTMKVALLATALGLGLGVGISGSAAQGPASDVAYVEAVSGRVIASSQGKPTPLDVLDVIGDRTELDLPPNSELRICHYRIQKLLTLRGPLHASISTSGVTAGDGKPIYGATKACTTPVVSTFQGGIVTRTMGITAINVPLSPNVKVVNRGTQTIRRISLWDGQRQTLLMNFNGTAARPTFNDGKSYLLVVEHGDGSESSFMLQATAATQPSPFIVVIR
jgi:hypothetical protein